MKASLILRTLAGIFFVLTALLWPAHPFDLSIKRVVIPPGSSAGAAQNILVSNRILPFYTPFKLMVKLTGLHNRIQAGEYEFSPSDSLYNVIGKLYLGQALPEKQKKVVFPEGISIYKMGLVLRKAGFSDWKAFQNLVNEGLTAPLRERHWGVFKYIPSESLEGYLFPDTYQFIITASTETMVEKMLNRFEAAVMPKWNQWKKDASFSLHEIITLASIIEKEAKIPEERPIISSVFYNRLKAGMPLAADPTIKYALERPTKRVFYSQLEINSLYNTYKRKGLPPGPICNPGIDSIKAAVYPAKSNYFFFVARKDGSHVFSRSWKEHLRAISQSR